jgi:hypothetical protein
MTQKRYEKRFSKNEIKTDPPQQRFEHLSGTCERICLAKSFQPVRPIRALMWVITLMLCAFTVSAVVCAEENFKRLTGQQIRAKFTGMELTDESHWGNVFERDGTLRLFSMGHKSVGKWRIQKDQLCLDRGNEPGGGCFEVWISGKKVELRNDYPPLEGVLQKPTDR